jgi:hypothetical protein
MPGILDLYASAGALTGRMLEAARRGAWDDLVALERERGVLIEYLRVHDPDPSKHDAAHKREWLERMLRQDEEIAVLTQDWMHELREVLDTLGNGQKIERAYGQDTVV